MKNKLGVIFAVSVMALAGIGISYAGFTDTITVHGTVTTATVDHTIGTSFSGTWVWKVWGQGITTEIYIDHTGGTDWQLSYPTGTHFLLVAWATAAPGATGTDHDVELTWTNIFPCIPFCCDFDFIYTGSIPAKINSMSIVYDTGSWVDDVLSYELYIVGPSGVHIPVGLGYQLHDGDIVHCVFCIHLPQDDWYQGKSASGHASLQLVQWNEYPYTPGP